MDVFLELISSFPVSIYSVLLIVAVVYWLVASLGFIDLKSPDAGGADGLDGSLDGAADGALDGAADGLEVGDGFEAPDGLDGLDGADAGDVGDTGDVGDIGSESAIHGGLAGLLLKLGLHGVPLTIVITLIALIGWLTSYFGLLALIEFSPGLSTPLAHYGLGSLLFLVTLALAVRLTAFIIRPLRRLSAGSRDRARQSLVGRRVTIRSGTAGHRSGQAVCEGYGADLILQVRTRGPEQSFSRGEQAVILRYDPQGHHYIIISEDEFRAR